MTIIFDLDGTLVNSLCDLGDSVNAALEEHGLPTRTYDEYRRFVGNGTKMLISRAVPDSVRGTDTEAVIFERFSAIYEQNCLCKTRPYDGIAEVLQQLKNSGVRLAVASNKPREFSRKIVYTLFGDDLFDLVEGSRDGVNKKPHPDIICNIVSQLGVAMEDCVVVGDSDVDVQTAKNAGVPCIGCTWGFRDRQTLEQAGCDVIIDSAYEIESALQKLRSVRQNSYEKR